MCIGIALAELNAWGKSIRNGTCPSPSPRGHGSSRRRYLLQFQAICAPAGASSGLRPFYADSYLAVQLGIAGNKGAGCPWHGAQVVAVVGARIALPLKLLLRAAALTSPRSHGVVEQCR